MNVLSPLRQDGGRPLGKSMANSSFFQGRCSNHCAVDFRAHTRPRTLWG